MTKAEQHGRHKSIKYTGGQRVLWSIKIVINSTLFDAQNAGNK